MEPSRSQLPVLQLPVFSGNREAHTGSVWPTVAASSLPISVVIESLFVLCKVPQTPGIKSPNGQGYCLCLELLLNGPYKHQKESSPLMFPGTTSRPRLQIANLPFWKQNKGSLEISESWREDFLTLPSVQFTQPGKLDVGSTAWACPVFTGSQVP